MCLNLTDLNRDLDAVQRLFQRLETFFDDSTFVIADTGDALFASAASPSTTPPTLGKSQSANSYRVEMNVL